jgi:hypothetical protein
MVAFSLWLLLWVICWPLALLALLLCPLLWILLVPLRLIRMVFEGTLALVRALVFLPARRLGARRYGGLVRERLQVAHQRCAAACELI